MLSACFALELQAQKTLVAAVHPGWVQTDMGGDMVRPAGAVRPANRCYACAN